MRRIKFTGTNANKRAEMSLTVVVSAVIALVVLIVLIYIFTNSSTKTSKTFGSCEINGGKCVAASESCPDKSFPITGTCASEGLPKCCSNPNILGN